MIVLEGPWKSWETPDVATSLTIGVLDGVHLGHRALLSRLDPSMRRTVLTFEPHPVEVLRPGTPPRLLTTIPERTRLLGEAGVDLVGVLDLTRIKDLSPDEFVTRILVGKLGVGHVVVGEDFRFGRDRTGDVNLLARIGDRAGFALDVIGIVDSGGTPVSSSRIRSLIEDGEVSGASALMGSRFTVTSTVIDGDKRGRVIGFPTANLAPPERKVIPARGVYACFASVDGVRHHAAVNVGVRPTFGGEELLIEAYLLDFDADIYGNDLTVEFVQYLRPELTFPGVDPLIEQMSEDVATTRTILSGVL